MDINLKDYVDKSKEVELAKLILTVLAVKAEATGETQKVRLTVRGKRNGKV